MLPSDLSLRALAATVLLAFAGGCAAPSSPTPPVATGATPNADATTSAERTTRTAAATPPPGATTASPASLSADPLVAPSPVEFEKSIARAGVSLFAQAARLVGDEPRLVVIDPLIDANTGAQTASTVKMGAQLESLAKRARAGWQVKPLTREALAQRPLLLIGTLTPVTVERSIDTVPDAFRVWLTMIDLRTGKVIAKQIDRATVGSVDAEPLKFYQDAPTWTKDKTVLGYINSCQVNTRIGDPADPDYLARLPAAAVVNEAILAYDGGQVPLANRLYKEAEPIADPGDLRVLNGLYVTSWQLGQREAARDAFGKLVVSGLEQKRLPVKLLFQPGRTQFNAIGDLPQQYGMWIAALAQKAGQTGSCVRVVGHTSRTGSARANETLSRQRAEAIQRLLEKDNRALASRLSVVGVGSREALVGLGTDDARDALDRRVEFRVVDCV